MDKENVVNISSGILSSHRKDGNPAIHNNMDKNGRRYVKGNKSDLERQILYDITYMWNLKKKIKLTDRIDWFPQDGGGGCGGGGDEMSEGGQKNTNFQL